MAQVMPKEILGLLAGAEESVTFENNATSIEITTDQPLYIATIQAKLAIPSTGLEGDRIFIAGQSYGERKRWKGKNVYVKSASALDSTRIQIIGDPS